MNEQMKAFRAFLTTMVTQLNGLVPGLTSPFKEVYQKFRDDMDELLKKLGPLDQQKTAQEANYGFEYLMHCLMSAQQVIQGMYEGMNRQAMQMNSLVKAEVDRLVTAGELLRKDAAMQLVESARTTAGAEASAAATAKFSLMTARRAKLGDLPAPAEEVLGLGDNEFDAAVAEARRRKQELEGRGLKLEGAFAHMAWAPKAAYDQQSQMVQQVLGNGRSGARTAPPVEPLLPGGGAGSGGAGAEEVVIA